MKETKPLTPEERFDHVCERFGGRSEMIRLLGARQQRLSNWRRRGIPEALHYEIVAKSGGRVRLADLRGPIPTTEEA